ALARGGVGMTTVAYCAVGPHGRTFADQMVMSAELAQQLRPLTAAVHAEGAAAAIQLGHCGGFSKDLDQRKLSPKGPLGPSRDINLYGVMKGLIWTKPMTASYLDVVVEQFATASGHAVHAG